MSVSSLSIVRMDSIGELKLANPRSLELRAGSVSRAGLEEDCEGGDGASLVNSKQHQKG